LVNGNLTLTQKDLLQKIKGTTGMSDRNYNYLPWKKLGAIAP
jgi:hypothetical protein